MLLKLSRKQSALQIVKVGIPLTAVNVVWQSMLSPTLASYSCPMVPSNECFPFKILPFTIQLCPTAHSVSVAFQLLAIPF